MDTEPRKNVKHDSEKKPCILTNSSVFGKLMENVTKHRYIKLATTKAKRNYLVSEPNYHTTKISSDNLLAKEIKKRRG